MSCVYYMKLLYTPLLPPLSPLLHSPPYPSIFFIVIEQFDVNVNIDIIFTIFLP